MHANFSFFFSDDSIVAEIVTVVVHEAIHVSLHSNFNLIIEAEAYIFSSNFSFVKYLHSFCTIFLYS